MAQYNISVSGNQLVIELIVTGGDFAPSIVSLKNPSIKLTTDRIKFYDSGVYNMALFFNQINEIDGVAPTDLEDATDKIIALIANFNGGGAAPSYKVYTALLTQTGTNAPVATVLENTLGGDIVYTYFASGDYRLVLPISPTSIDKIVAIHYPSLNNEGYVLQIAFEILNTNELRVNGIYDLFSQATVSDGAISNDRIEIRVYN